MNSEDFKKNLEQFIGTQHYYRYTQYPLLATDGVNYFLETTEAIWLIHLIAYHINILKEPFVTVELNVKETQVELIFTDGNDKVLQQGQINIKGIPEGEYKFFVTDNVIMLPSEY